ncbi:golgin subfamily A member 6-like protein 7 [Paralichthys olivaceus]|uniref:golgin subfamily A member 6-like protein 7 n=1 Tax=Paralichthys olivaceus TaxID=8255 RepID=UPI0037534EE3
MANNGEHKVHYNCKDCRKFQRDVKYLEHLLDKERARGRQQRQLRLTLCEALDEANAKLAKVHPREQNNCDRDGDTWQPEEGDFNDTMHQSEVWDEDKDALSTAEILTETTKQSQEIDLHRCYKELQEAQRFNQQRFAVELQAERSKNEALIHELEKLRASNKEVIEKYEVDNLRAKQQVTDMRAELAKAVRSQMDTFQAEQNLIRTRIMEEMRCLRKKAAEEKMLLQKEVEEMTSQLSLMERENESHTINQQRLAVDLQAERSKTKALLDEVEKLRASNKDISEKFLAEELRAKQQVTNMTAEFEKTVRSQMDTFQAEQNLVRTRIMEEMRCLHKNVAEEKMLLQKEVEEMTSQLSLEEREDVKHQEWQKEKEEEKQEEKEGEEEQDKQKKQEESLSDALPAPQPVETEVSDETPKKEKRSIWKKIRRCLGVRRRRQ